MSDAAEPQEDNRKAFISRQGKHIDCLHVEIKTSRLKLLPTSPEFAEDMFKEFTAEVTRYMGPSPSKSIDETLKFIEDSLECMRQGDHLQFVILNRESGEFLGCCGLHGQGKPQTPELGIWIKACAHGNGYGKEAIFGLKRWADENLKYEYLIYPVDRRNQASIRIPEALGGEVFKQDTTERADSSNLDLVVYKIPNEICADIEGHCGSGGASA